MCFCGDKQFQAFPRSKTPISYRCIRRQWTSGPNVNLVHSCFLTPIIRAYQATTISNTENSGSQFDLQNPCCPDDNPQRDLHSTSETFLGTMPLNPLSQDQLIQKEIKEKNLQSYYNIHLNYCLNYCLVLTRYNQESRFSKGSKLGNLEVFRERCLVEEWSRVATMSNSTSRMGSRIRMPSLGRERESWLPGGFKKRKRVKRRRKNSLESDHLPTVSR